MTKYDEINYFNNFVDKEIERMSGKAVISLRDIDEVLNYYKFDNERIYNNILVEQFMENTGFNLEVSYDEITDECLYVINNDIKFSIDEIGLKAKKSELKRVSLFEEEYKDEFDKFLYPIFENYFSISALTHIRMMEYNYKDLNLMVDSDGVYVNINNKKSILENNYINNSDIKTLRNGVLSRIVIPKEEINANIIRLYNVYNTYHDEVKSKVKVIK